MKTKDLLIITTAAVGTAVLTVATFWPGPMEAGGDIEGPAAKIIQPKLTVHGVEMGLAIAGGRTIKAGEQPEFELTAVNQTDHPAGAKVCVMMTSSSRADDLSRVIRLPATLWQQELVLNLSANETKVIPLTATPKVPHNSLVSVHLRETEPGVMAAASSSLNQALLASRPSEPEIIALTFSTMVLPAPAVAAVASSR